MTTWIWRGLVAILFLLLGACGAPAPAPTASPLVVPPPRAPGPDADRKPVSSGEPWRIGAVLSLSGAMAQFGIDTRDGIDLAVEQINTRGGAAGRPLKVAYRNDAGQPVPTRDAVRALIADDHAIAILGEVSSALTRVGGAVANELKTPMLSPGSTNVEVTQVGEFVFAAVASDDEHGAFAAKYAVSELKKKRIAILSTTGDAYSALVGGTFRAAVPRHGGTVVADVTVARDHADLDAALATLKAAQADVIFAPVYYTTMGVLGPRARALGMPGSLFLGADGWDSEELWASDAGDALEGAQFLTHWIADAPSAASRAFVETFRARSNRVPNALAAFGFESTMLLADAIGRAEQPTAQGIRDALASTRRFEGLLGVESMEANRRPRKPFVVGVLRSRDVKWAATIGAK